MYNKPNIYRNEIHNKTGIGYIKCVICFVSVILLGAFSALQGYAHTSTLPGDTVSSPSETNFVIPRPFTQDIPATNQPLMDSLKVRASWLALKTNLLYDACLIPNIGVEFNLGKRWTITFDWFYTWFSADSRHRYWQGYGGYLGVRKYFGKNSQGNFLSPKGESEGASFPRGHHLGLYTLGMTYDVEWGGKGYQAARFGFGAGVEYGYSMRIGRRLNLDLSVGMGFQDGEYKEYVPSNDEYNHYIWKSTHKRHWWGPTKAEVSLVWVL